MKYYNMYKDLYHEAQTDINKGKYKVFLFDVAGSKKHSTRDREKFYKGFIDFLNQTTTDLLELEKVKGHKILHRHLEVEDLKENEVVEDKVVLLKNQSETKHYNKVLRFDQLNPIYWMGDLINFIVERDSISDKEFMQIIQKNKDHFIPNYDLHFESGYYETDVWHESSDKFSRVYCFPVLEELSKESGKMVTSPDHLEQTDGREL